VDPAADHPDLDYPVFTHSAPELELRYRAEVRRSYSMLKTAFGWLFAFKKPGSAGLSGSDSISSWVRLCAIPVQEK